MWREINDTLDYYRNGADGYAPTHPNIEVTNKKYNADIVLQFDDPFYGDEMSSDSEIWGYDVDDDRPLEVYSEMTITISMQITDANDQDQYVAWYLGYELGWVFGGQDEVLPPFQDEPKKGWEH